MADGRIATTDLTLPLDSVLAWAWMMREHPERMAASQSGMQPDDVIVPELPLERRGSGDSWYWACSFAFGQPVLENKAYWHKRFDAQASEDYADFGKRSGKVNVGAGHYKNYRMPLVVFLVPRLEWWLVGDQAAVEALLTRVTHLGKKRSQGFGRVARWEVGRTDEDYSNARPIPTPDGDDMATIRPPYWLHTNERYVRWPQQDGLACNWVRRGLVANVG